MFIVGSGMTSKFSKVVLAVLSCDWSEEWVSFKLLKVEVFRVG